MTNKEFFQQCWKAEVTPTLTALKALPSADKLSYKPAEKNRTAKQLVDHFVSHVEDLIEAVETGIINHRVMADYPTTENAIDVFVKETDRLIALIDNVDDKAWEEKTVPMLVFGNKAFEQSLGQMCWSFLFDIIHHRGQLSTYYRPMGAAQPAIYGPTAEMVEARMAESPSAN
ncbi:MAG TPA: DinB family protein [Ferruginibacter sp.]|nr:DinB family protein [Ferruginibacter sp.]